MRVITSEDMPLAQNPLDRAAHMRVDPEAMARARQDPNVLVCLLRAGEPFLEGRRASMSAIGPGEVARGETSRLVWLGPEAFDLAPEALSLFLGLDRQATPVFGLDMPVGWSPQGSLVEGAGDFEDMRAAATRLSTLEANCAATARALFEWHRRHGYCANCGSSTQSVDAGWKRICPSCEAQHFPRTDPVAIMLAEHEGRCLLGRQRNWPAGFVSCLAGFVEPGETVEQAAARELHEEAGITSDAARAQYLFCQPWPFPSSLMIGLILPATSTEITVDPSELEDAWWVPRDEARAMLAGEHPELYCPPPMAVAHHILNAWASRDD